jgi:RimJ/RimL family protein N-acetyltransferase
VPGDDGVVRETPRLRLRRLRPGDLDEVSEMVADPEQMRYYPRPKTRDEVAAWLVSNIAVYDDNGFGVWCLESVPDSAFAGYCGIRPLTLDGRREIELVWHVKKTYWNRGFATEAALVSTQLGRGEFRLPSLVAIIHPSNGASRRVAQKLRMEEQRSVIHDGEPVVVYRTSRD